MNAASQCPGHSVPIGEHVESRRRRCVRCDRSEQHSAAPMESAPGAVAMIPNAIAEPNRSFPTERFYGRVGPA
jgi:hypothetical protein